MKFLLDYNITIIISAEKMNPWWGKSKFGWGGGESIGGIFG